MKDRTKTLVKKINTSFADIFTIFIIDNNKETKMLPSTKNSGFTLVELVMVIVIIAILAIIANPIYIKLYSKAFENNCLTVIENLKIATMNKYLENLANNQHFYEEETGFPEYDFWPRGNPFLLLENPPPYLEVEYILSNSQDNIHWRINGLHGANDAMYIACPHWNGWLDRSGIYDNGTKGKVWLYDPTPLIGENHFQLKVDNPH